MAKNKDKMVAVVFKGGFRTKLKPAVATILLGKGEVELPKDYEARIQREIEEKKPDDVPEDETSVDDDPVKDGDLSVSEEQPEDEGPVDDIDEVE